MNNPRSWKHCNQHWFGRSTTLSCTFTPQSHSFRLISTVHGHVRSTANAHCLIRLPEIKLVFTVPLRVGRNSRLTIGDISRCCLDQIRSVSEVLDFSLHLKIWYLPANTCVYMSQSYLEKKNIYIYRHNKQTWNLVRFSWSTWQLL